VLIDCLSIQVVRKVLRQIAITGRGEKTFNYQRFKDLIRSEPFSAGQRDPLTIRLELLESFLDMTRGGKSDIWDFQPGSLTIVDLSCPFVDETSACTLFDICLSLFLEQDTKVGKIIALDEAHKVGGSCRLP
jgi:hypothetical protein